MDYTLHPAQYTYYIQLYIKYRREIYFLSERDLIGLRFDIYYYQTSWQLRAQQKTQYSLKVIAAFDFLNSTSGASGEHILMFFKTI